MFEYFPGNYVWNLGVVAALNSGGLIVGPVRVVERDLPVARTVGDEERHRDLLDDAVEVDLAGERDELIEGVVTPDPQDVVPVVRHGPLPLALQPAALDRAPVMVGAPGDDQGEPLLEGGGARRVVPAQGPADQAVASPKRELRIFTAEEGATEHIGLDHLPHVSTFIADWVADTFAELSHGRR